MNHFKYLIVAALLLTGCAQTPKVAMQTQPEALVQPVAEPAAPVASVVLPDVELNSELLYEFLLSELANQRGHKALAVESSTDIAEKTRDPRLAKRAAQLALESGNMNKSVAAFRLWHETDPSAILATRMLSSLLLRGGKLEEARGDVISMLKEDGANAGHTFLQLYPMVAPNPDKAAALKLMRDLAAPYPAIPEAHWVVAKLAQAAGDNALALIEVSEARKLRPEWAAAAALEAQLAQQPADRLDILKQYLLTYPGEAEVRLQYARELLAQKQYEAAHTQFRQLSQGSPDNLELAFAVALVSLQLNDLTGAEAELKSALLKGGRGKDVVAYFLGQLNEAKENEADALKHYLDVNEGEYRYPAQLRVVYLLNKQSKLDEARKVLHQMQATTDVQRAQLVIIEAQLLREAKQLPAAYRILQQGLVRQPGHPELLYETAMLADRLGKYQLSEKLLRKLIRIKPGNAHAYNALGYSLLERNVRIAEAVSLVEKALTLAPDDYAIMDSVGWGYYRSGRLDKSVSMLRRAFAGNPDPEVAAHLGEALWAHGDQEEATKLWQDSLKTSPDNVQLKAVMKRFLP